ncbi:hypothetical protein [Granulicella mallensis]|uniref:Uncharacterized protein n=1 Tax=Granulicella mallensis TaxID=940614 RepID=A0A7W7ZNJ7_9BACT|nr:hypothetical protein [Granulicella mallensis]MBB5063240.1 hypothetical protein [Granulicella mallensis]
MGRSIHIGATLRNVVIAFLLLRPVIVISINLYNTYLPSTTSMDGKWVGELKFEGLNTANYATDEEADRLPHLTDSAVIRFTLAPTTLLFLNKNHEGRGELEFTGSGQRRSFSVHVGYMDDGSKQYLLDFDVNEPNSSSDSKAEPRFRLVNAWFHDGVFTVVPPSSSLKSSPDWAVSGSLHKANTQQEYSRLFIARAARRKYDGS